MFPSFQLFGLTVNLYGICAAVGIGFTTLVFWLLYRQRKIDGFTLALSAIFALIGGFGGAHLLYGLTRLPLLFGVLSHFDKYIHNVNDFFDLLGQVFGGMVFYGGLFGGAMAVLLYFRRTKQPLGDYADLYAVGVPLFHAFGRLGCFFAGCCYGIECRFGFTMHNAITASANGISRFPVQLLEAVLLFCLALLLCFLYRKNRLRGKLLRCYLLLYGAIRFGTEFLRADTYRGILFGLSTSQWISLLLILAGAIWFIAERRASRCAAINDITTKNAPS